MACIHPLVAVAQQGQVGVVGVEGVVGEELLQVGLLAPLVVEEQLSEHLVKRQPQLVTVHDVLVLLDFGLEELFVLGVLLRQTDAFLLHQLLTQLLLLVLDVGQLDAALLVQRVWHACLPAFVEDYRQLGL